MRRRVADARVAVLATVDPDGRPHLVPVTFAVDGDRVYTAVDHKPKTTTQLRRLANIERDERVTVLVHSYDDDWSALWWCRLRGRGRVLPSSEDSTTARKVLADKYPQYSDEPLTGPVIAIDVDEWRGWSAR